MRKYDTTLDGKGKEQQHQHLEQELRNSMVVFPFSIKNFITFLDLMIFNVLFG